MAKGDTDLQLANKHRYRLPNGEIAINVTAISGLMDDGKSGAFAGDGMSRHLQAPVRRSMRIKKIELEFASRDRGQAVHAEAIDHPTEDHSRIKVAGRSIELVHRA
jgi:hypothetical protein